MAVQKTGTKNNITEAWKLYDLGRLYNESLVPSQYQLCKTNTEFFAGNQWINLPDTPAMKGLPKPTFNILKRVASLFIASLTSADTVVRFEPMAYYDGHGSVDPDHDVAEFANAMVDNLLNKFKFKYRLRDALYDGAILGDYCAHFFFDPDAEPYGGIPGPQKGEIQMELLDGTSVLFGNPNDRRVQEQPYIIVVARYTVDQLKWMAERYKANKDSMGSGTGATTSDINMIQPDSDNQDFLGIGGSREIVDDDGTGKALAVYLYTKRPEMVPQFDPQTREPIMEDKLGPDGNPEFEMDENGEPRIARRQVTKLVDTVHVTLSTRTAVIYENVDTGLTLYPIAWGNWEKQKNQYHGRALVTGLLPNQIFINTMFATAMRHAQLGAFPKTVFNADLISSWSNEIGQAIGVHGLQPGMSISQVAENLRPAEMSSQIFALIDKVMAYTKECLGATDAQMGNVKPDNTSALMVLQTNAEVPLENIRAGLYEWVEDIAGILLDMAGTYYGKRPIVVPKTMDEVVMGPGGTPVLDPMTGMMQTQSITRRVVEEFDFSILKKLYLGIYVDVGATTYFSEIAMTQTLDNLRKDGTLDVIQYLERLPDKLIPKKTELIAELRKRIGQGQQSNAAAGAAIPEPGAPVTASKPDSALPIMGGELSKDAKVAGLPVSAEVGFNDLPNIAKKTALEMGGRLAE